MVPPSGNVTPLPHHAAASASRSGGQRSGLEGRNAGRASRASARVPSYDARRSGKGGKMKFDEAMDFVQMRDGSSYVGSVTTSRFNIDTGLSKPIVVPSDRIVWIIFRNKDGYPKDRIQLKDASELAGSVREKSIDFESDAIGKIRIPTAKILSLQLLSSFGE
jgi:hypothetical protein